MSMEEFNEFRRKLAESVFNLKRDVRRYPIFNADCAQQNATCRSEALETDTVERSLGKQWRKMDLPSSERCCVAVKFNCGFMRCNRRRSPRVLNASLEKIALAKKLNVAICNEDPHMGICLFHYRLIKSGKQVSTKEELMSVEANESRADKCERDGETSDVILGESCTSSERDSDEDTGTDDGKRDILQKTKLNWQEVDVKRKKIRYALEDADEDDDRRDSEEEERSGLSTLSAASLRRYRKFFMIPTKASASKHAMLEGVASHFERLPVRASDAIVHFIHTAKTRINTIE